MPEPELASNGHGSRPDVLARVPASALVVLSIVSVQVGGALAATIFDRASPAVVVLLRIGLAAVILLLIARPAPWTWDRLTLRSVGALGVTLVGMNLCFYVAIETVPLGIAVTIEFLGPLLVSVLQARRAIDLLAIGCAGLGVILLGWPSNSPNAPAPLGLALAFLAGMFWGAYIMASSKVGENSKGIQGLAAAMFVGAIIAVPFGVSGLGQVLADPGVLAICLVIAVLSSLIPYTFELAALRRIPTRVFGVLMSIEPAVAALAGFLIVGQDLSVRSMAAIVMVIAASAIVTLTNRARLPVQPLE
ncbi:MAG: EamA family transporter [Actinomycetes bacterium]